MPIYEYVCKTCREEFEAVLSFMEPLSDMPCPKCGDASHKKMSVPTVIYVGSGFTKAIKNEENNSV